LREVGVDEFTRHIGLSLVVTRPGKSPGAAGCTCEGGPCSSDPAQDAQDDRNLRQPAGGEGRRAHSRQPCRIDHEVQQAREEVYHDRRLRCRVPDAEHMRGEDDGREDREVFDGIDVSLPRSPHGEAARETSDQAGWKRVSARSNQTRRRRGRLPKAQLPERVAPARPARSPSGRCVRRAGSETVPRHG
jgi:hypothetical protein